MNMKPFKKLHLHFLILFNVILGTSIGQHDHTNYCRNIGTETPSLNLNSSVSSLFGSITLCRSQNLYFRTSLGLFQVSSVDYNGRLLTISQPCSSSLQYVSPLAVTAGFPSPPEPTSLILFNCSSRRDPIPPFIQNCRGLYKCATASSLSYWVQEQEKNPYSCLVVEDMQQVDKGFHPQHWNCSHYSWVHRSCSDGGDYEGFKLGTRLSFNISHEPDLCQECEKPNDNCGSGLKCLCHPKECKDKVISNYKGGSIKSTGTGGVFFSLLAFIAYVLFAM